MRMKLLVKIDQSNLLFMIEFKIILSSTHPNSPQHLFLTLIQVREQETGRILTLCLSSLFCFRLCLFSFMIPAKETASKPTFPLRGLNISISL